PPLTLHYNLEGVQREKNPLPKVSLLNILLCTFRSLKLFSIVVIYSEKKHTRKHFDFLKPGVAAEYLVVCTFGFLNLLNNFFPPKEELVATHWILRHVPVTICNMLTGKLIIVVVICAEKIIRLFYADIFYIDCTSRLQFLIIVVFTLSITLLTVHNILQLTLRPTLIYYPMRSTETVFCKIIHINHLQSFERSSLTQISGNR
ncbi:hypothetical protein L9F63_023243, partial [Diploptera punctata]